jgi:hypothetical protein
MNVNYSNYVHVLQENRYETNFDSILLDNNLKINPMKKKSIKKLALKKAAISTLNTSVVKGGNDQNSVFPCLSVNFCETLDYTRCYAGQLVCAIYTGPSEFGIC